VPRNTTILGLRRDESFRRRFDNASLTRLLCSLILSSEIDLKALMCANRYKLFRVNYASLYNF